MRFFAKPDASESRIQDLLNCGFTRETTPPATLHLRLDAEGLSLTDGALSLRGDFTGEKQRLRPNNLNGELPVRAARLKNETFPTLLDATAGLGTDSFLLAAAGFRVTLFEYDPVVAELLNDALLRAREDPDLFPIVSRMTLRRDNSINAMQNGATADVIFLDPMFPARTKSALIGKKFQLLQQLQPPCDNGEELLEAALQSGAKKIVVKRPAKGEWLGNRKPSYVLTGKAVRYDVLIPPQKSKE